MINCDEIWFHLYILSINISKLTSNMFGFSWPRSADLCQFPTGLLIRVQPASQCCWGRRLLGYHKAPWESLEASWSLADPGSSGSFPPVRFPSWILQWISLDFDDESVSLSHHLNRLGESKNRQTGMDAKLATALPCGWNGIQIRWRHRDRSTDLRVLVIKRAIHGHQHVESVSSYGILWHGVEIEVPALVRNTESLYMQDYAVYIIYQDPPSISPKTRFHLG